MKPLSNTYQKMAVVAMLLYATAVQGQLTTGGDFGGGYLWKHSQMTGKHMMHMEGKGNWWVSYKAKNFDWRLSLTAQYKDKDSEKRKVQIPYDNGQNPFLSVSASATSVYPFNLTARYDFNWRRPNKSVYSLWAMYDYEHVESNAKHFATTISLHDNMFYVRTEERKTVSNEFAVGYCGTTQLNACGLALHSSADIMVRGKTVKDEWMRGQLNLLMMDMTPKDIRGWEMHPDYFDYAVKADVSLTDTVVSTPSTRLMVGGGIRFKADGEHFEHELRVPDEKDSRVVAEHVFIDQRATGFRYFVEPYLCADWRSGKWALNAEYGLRLYHMTTTDKTGHAVLLFNVADTDHPLSGSSFSHFTPLVNGRARLTYKAGRHHSVSLTNTIANRLPSNQQSVLCFVQASDYNKLLLGNPHLKPEVKVRMALEHTLSSGPFAATTELSVERIHNQMDEYLYGCMLEGRNELARVTLNIANVSICKVSETLAWNSKRVKASATVWKHWARNEGIGSVFEGCDKDNNNYGWKLEGKAHLGCGWLVATNLQYTGEYLTVASLKKRVWQSSTVVVEKDFGPITLYLHASRLIDPNIRLTQFMPRTQSFEVTEYRASNRMLMVGCRWSLR